MPIVMWCSICEQAISGSYSATEDGYIHADKDECARLKELTTNPLIVAGRELGNLLAEKNAAYGSSYAKCGEFLKLLYPNGVKPDQYTDMLLLVRIFDKQMRIATRKDALGESPFRDIAGYGILGTVKDA